MRNILVLLLSLALGVTYASAAALQASQESIDKTKLLFRRITGVPLNNQDPRLLQMAQLIENGEDQKAAAIATEDVYFYHVTLKNMAAVMSNRTETPYVGLDDFQATFIGAVRDELDARTLLTGNYLYRDKSNNIEDPSRRDNKHYEAIDEQGFDYKSNLVKQEPQWSDMRNHAGLLTTRGWAISHYDAGTNRRAVVYAIQEFLCTPIESWKVAHLPDNFVGRDVDRCSGGKWDANQKKCVGDVNPKTFSDQCQTCHAGMDAQRGAFSSMDTVNGSFVELPPQRPAPKYSHNSGTYPDGHITNDDSWTIPLAIFNSQALGFDAKIPSEGTGINAYAQVLANSSAFKTCMAKRVFNQVCMRSTEVKDQALLKVLANHFEKNNFNLKKLFQETAVLPACMGD